MVMMPMFIAHDSINLNVKRAEGEVGRGGGGGTVGSMKIQTNKLNSKENRMRVCTCLCVGACATQ